MNLSDALSWLEDNEETINSDNICLISKLPIENEITLPCGHKFDYMYLYEFLKSFKSKHPNIKNKIQCPYCREKFEGFVPYYEIPSMEEYMNKNITSKFKNNILKCSYEFKSGKKKGLMCECCAHNFKVGTYCLKHKNQIQNKFDKSIKSTVNQCEGLTSKNERCKCKAIKDSNYCRYHNGNK